MIPVINNKMTGAFMGFNFRKSLKIAPGVKINITKKGVSSLSVGKNGARVNVGKKGIKTTVGIPGSGISYSKHSSYNNPPPLPNNPPPFANNSAPFANNPPPLPLQKAKDENSIGFGTLLLIGLLLLFPIIWIFG